MNTTEVFQQLDAVDETGVKHDPERAEFFIGKLIDLTDMGKRPVFWLDTPATLSVVTDPREFSNLEVTLLSFVGVGQLSAHGERRVTRQGEIVRAIREVSGHIGTVVNLSANLNGSVAGVGVRHALSRLFMEAIWAGAYELALTEKATYIIRRPDLTTDDQGRLSDTSKPAIRWPGGPYRFYINGVSVPERVVMHPERITAAQINAEANIEVRRVMMEQMGFGKYMRSQNGRLISTDDWGKLWTCQVPNDHPLWLVEVQNSTPEPDGTVHTYFLRVPANIRNPLEALAWTFNMTPNEYKELKRGDQRRES